MVAVENLLTVAQLDDKIKLANEKIENCKDNYLKAKLQGFVNRCLDAKQKIISYRTKLVAKHPALKNKKDFLESITVFDTKNPKKAGSGSKLNVSGKIDDPLGKMSTRGTLAEWFGDHKGIVAGIGYTAAALQVANTITIATVIDPETGMGKDLGKLLWEGLKAVFGSQIGRGLVFAGALAGATTLLLKLPSIQRNMLKKKLAKLERKNTRMSAAQDLVTDINELDQRSEKGLRTETMLKMASNPKFEEKIIAALDDKINSGKLSNEQKLFAIAQKNQYIKFKNERMKEQNEGARQVEEQKTKMTQNASLESLVATGVAGRPNGAAEQELITAKAKQVSCANELRVANEEYKKVYEEQSAGPKKTIEEAQQARDKAIEEAGKKYLEAEQEAIKTYEEAKKEAERKRDDGLKTIDGDASKARETIAAHNVDIDQLDKLKRAQKQSSDPEKLQAAKKELSSLRESTITIDREIIGIDSEIRTLQGEISSYPAKIAKEDEDIENSNDNIRRIRKSISNSNSKVNVEVRKAQADVVKYTKQCGNYAPTNKDGSPSTRYATAAKKLEDAKAQLETAKAEQKREEDFNTSEIQKFEEKIKAAEAKKEALRKEQEQKQTMLDEKEALKKQKEADKKAIIESEIPSLTAKIADIERDIRSMKDKIAAQNKKVSDGSDAYSKAVGFLSALRQKQKELRSEATRTIEAADKAKQRKIGAAIDEETITTMKANDDYSKIESEEEQKIADRTKNQRERKENAEVGMKTAQQKLDEAKKKVAPEREAYGARLVAAQVAFGKDLADLVLNSTLDKEGNVAGITIVGKEIGSEPVVISAAAEVSAEHPLTIRTQTYDIAKKDFVTTEHTITSQQEFKQLLERVKAARQQILNKQQEQGLASE